MQIEICASDKENKKYRARLLSDKKWIYFGHPDYEQYRDSTGLGLWSHKDHKDNKRRRLFYSRHGKNIDKAITERRVTPALLSALFLW